MSNQRDRDSAARLCSRSSTLAQALRIIAGSTFSADGVVTTCLMEAASRLEQLEEIVRPAMPKVVAVADSVPPDKTWCWVSDDGKDWSPAMRMSKCAGGWTNVDTWEDFDQSVRFWAPLGLAPDALD